MFFFCHLACWSPFVFCMEPAVLVIPFNAQTRELEVPWKSRAQQGWEKKGKMRKQFDSGREEELWVWLGWTILMPPFMHVIQFPDCTPSPASPAGVVLALWLTASHGLCSLPALLHCCVLWAAFAKSAHQHISLKSSSGPAARLQGSEPSWGWRRDVAKILLKNPFAIHCKP